MRKAITASVFLLSTLISLPAISQEDNEKPQTEIEKLSESVGEMWVLSHEKIGSMSDYGHLDVQIRKLTSSKKTMYGLYLRVQNTGVKRDSSAWVDHSEIEPLIKAFDFMLKQKPEKGLTFFRTHYKTKGGLDVGVFNTDNINGDIMFFVTAGRGLETTFSAKVDKAPEFRALLVNAQAKIDSLKIDSLKTD